MTLIITAGTISTFNKWMGQQCPIKCTPFASKRKIVLPQ